LKRLAVGVIGTGFWGENQVRVFRQSRIADLVAICDADKPSFFEYRTWRQLPFAPPLRLI
jgi:predicted dehydrogenase